MGEWLQQESRERWVGEAQHNAVGALVDDLVELPVATRRRDGARLVDREVTPEHACGPVHGCGRAGQQQRQQHEGCSAWCQPPPDGRSEGWWWKKGHHRSPLQASAQER
ncbi:hypothetical protein GCM10029963_23550 [Micromonospora andamanensis]